MIISSIRYGFATNSSSSHSIVLASPGQKISGAHQDNLDFGWNTFVLTKPFSKFNYVIEGILACKNKSLKYLTGQEYYSKLREAGDDEIQKTILKEEYDSQNEDSYAYQTAMENIKEEIKILIEWAEIDGMQDAHAFLTKAYEDHELLTSILQNCYIDHQSEHDLADIKDRPEKILTLIFDSSVIIVGGNDNDDSETMSFFKLNQSKFDPIPSDHILVDILKDPLQMIRDDEDDQAFGYGRN